MKTPAPPTDDSTYANFSPHLGALTDLCQHFSLVGYMQASHQNRCQCCPCCCMRVSGVGRLLN